MKWRGDSERYRRHSLATSADHVKALAMQRVAGLLFEAIEEGDTELVRFKLNEHSRFPRDGAKPKVDCHPLCQCQACISAVAVSDTLGGPLLLGVVNDKGESMLHIATLSGISDTVAVLLEHGADTNAANAVGQTPLHMAALHGQMSIVTLLLDHGADPTATTNRQVTPLHFACQYNHGDVARALLSAGALPFAEDHAGNTPMHFCASNGHVDCAKVLIGKDGIRIDATNFRGETPLHNAARWGYIEMVAELLAAGAKTYITNHRKHTPREDTTNHSIAALLSAAEKKQGPGPAVKSPELALGKFVEVSNVPPPLVHLNGIYGQICVIDDPPLAGANVNNSATGLPDSGSVEVVSASRPVFEKVEGHSSAAVSQQPMTLFYSYTLKGWAIARYIGSDRPIAYAQEDAKHPGILSTAWLIINETGKYTVNIDVDVVSAPPPVPSHPEDEVLASVLGWTSTNLGGAGAATVSVRDADKREMDFGESGEASPSGANNVRAIGASTEDLVPGSPQPAIIAAAGELLIPASPPGLDDDPFVPAPRPKTPVR